MWAGLNDDFQEPKQQKRRQSHHRPPSPSDQGHGQPSPVDVIQQVQCDEMGTAPVGHSPQITRKHLTAQIRSQPTTYLIRPSKCQGHQRESESKLFQTIVDNGHL